MSRWWAGAVVGLLLLAGCSARSAPQAVYTPALAGAECSYMVSDNAGRNVRFGVGGATNLAGIIAGRGATGIVLAHEADSDLCIWDASLHELVGQGYRVLAFDFHGYGASESRLDANYDDDVLAAAAFLRADGASKIVLFGASMGGTYCLAAAARIQPPVTAVISASGPTAYGGVDAEDAVPSLKMPVLFVAEAEDTPFGDAAKTMYAKAKASSARVLKVPEGSNHGVQLVRPTNNDPEVRLALEHFLRTYAPPA
jgi:pimeloyl-ACP methyl ester carboxylesterase